MKTVESKYSDPMSVNCNKLGKYIRLEQKSLDLETDVIVIDESDIPALLRAIAEEAGLGIEIKAKP